MKINNKGISLIEMVVSISLISIVLIFLLQLLLTLREMDDKSLAMVNYQILSSDIMKTVQEQIKDQNNCDFNLANSNKKLTIRCSDVVDLTLDIQNNTIMLTDTINKENGADFKDSWEFASDAEIGTFNKETIDNLTVITLKIIDDKGINYPMEISYLKKD